VFLRGIEMPIFEFRCLECGDIFEKLFMHSDEKVELECPQCTGKSCERVVSRASHVMADGAGVSTPKISTKSCAPGNQCTTIDLPGYSK
jgi:putative FmdB family regulatory protein